MFAEAFKGVVANHKFQKSHILVLPRRKFRFLGNFGLKFIHRFLLMRHKYALLIEFALNIYEISKDVINCILCIISQETKLSGSV